jgi:hypothetical protein
MYSAKKSCLLVIFLLLIEVGCTKPIEFTLSSPPSREQTTTPIITKPTLTSIPIAHENPTEPTAPVVIESTLGPTIAPTERALLLLDLMKTNGGCNLPCILSVTSGKTTYLVGKSIFEQWGWSTWEQSLQFGKSLEVKSNFNESSLRANAVFQERDGVINNMHFSASGHDYLKYVDYYSLINTLAREGKPSKVWIFLPSNPPSSITSFYIFLYYKEKNLLIQYDGVATIQGDSIHICPPRPWVGSPDVGPNEGFVGIYVSSSEEGMSPAELTVPFGYEVGTFIGEKYQVDTILGMSIDEFYQDVLKRKTSACYDISKSAWP